MGRNSSIIDKNITTVLTSRTQKAFDYLRKQEWLSQRWYLAGGTALALQCGHRQSVDLDFFTQEKSFDTREISDRLSISNWKTVLREKTRSTENYRQ